MDNAKRGVQTWIKLMELCVFHKTLHNYVPQYLSEIVVLIPSTVMSRHFRSADNPDITGAMKQTQVQVTVASP